MKMEFEFRPAKRLEEHDPCGAVAVRFTHLAEQGNNGDPESTSPAVAIISHSSQPEGPALTFPADEWRRFLLGVKAGEFAIA